MVRRRTKGLQYALLSFEVTVDITIRGCRRHRREKESKSGEGGV